MNMFKLFAAAAVALSAGAGHAAVLYDNGPVVDGSSLSILAPASGALGFASNIPAGHTLADDFLVTGADWVVTSLDFYAYQTGAMAFSFTEAAWSIVAGDVNTGTIVASGTTSVTDGGLMGYRVTSSTLSSTQRPIYRINADITDISLAAGSYYLRWSLNGTLSSGPYAPPVDGSYGSGNGLQSTSFGAFEIPLNTPETLWVEMPFTINGTSGAIPEPTTWAMMIGGLGLVGASMRRRSAKLSFA